jgi:putative SOS response-associated peptidase YedK
MTEMCGRFTLRTPLTQLAKQFQFDLDAAQVQLPLRFNIAPTQDVAAVRLAGGKRELVQLRWGLVPSWAKDPKIGNTMINARAETVSVKPALRAAFKRRRCLVLADGYYEWLREGKIKQPYLYEINAGQPFAMAGLWESWRGTAGPDSPPLESCTIITTEANELARKNHDRMPVILHEADYAAWLDPACADVEYLLAPIEADPMTARAVGTHVNNARHEGPECIAPIEGCTS